MADETENIEVPISLVNANVPDELGNIKSLVPSVI